MDDLELLKKRLEYYGGTTKEQRLIHSKLLTFRKATQSAYQSCNILFNNKKYKVLINPDKIKQDYDDKIISAEYSVGLKPGSIINWVETNTYWIVFCQELSEDAYFRASIRRCNRLLKWITNGVKCSSYAYVRGPVETTNEHLQKTDLSIDKSKASLFIYLPDNADIKDTFIPYYRFMLDGKTWEVQTVDSISQEGVIELTAKRDYTNLDKDDKITNDIIVTPIIDKSEIQGEQLIQPMQYYNYKINNTNGHWEIEDSSKKLPIELTVVSSNEVKLIWKEFSSRYGKFSLKYVTDNEIYNKNIQVDSLF